MKFETYDVVPLRGHDNPETCEELDADFWGLYGIDKDGNAFAVGDFSSKSDAEFIRDAIYASG